jgi:hypothetical protein
VYRYPGPAFKLILRIRVRNPFNLDLSNVLVQDAIDVSEASELTSSQPPSSAVTTLKTVSASVNPVGGASSTDQTTTSPAKKKKKKSVEPVK